MRDHARLVKAYGISIFLFLLAGFYLFGCGKYYPRDKKVTIVSA